MFSAGPPVAHVLKGSEGTKHGAHTVPTQHIGFSYAFHRCSDAACGGKWALMPPYAARLRNVFCESACLRGALLAPLAEACFLSQVARTHANALSTKAARNRWHCDITNKIWPHGAQQTRHNSAKPSLVDTARTSVVPACEQSGNFVEVHISHIFGPLQLAKGFGFGKHVGYSWTDMRLTRCLRGVFARLTRKMPWLSSIFVRFLFPSSHQKNEDRVPVNTTNLIDQNFSHIKCKLQNNRPKKTQNYATLRTAVYSLCTRLL